MTSARHTSGFSAKSISDQLAVAVHVIPKKPGQSGHTEVHCLEDACILVRVPSSTSILQASKHESSERTLEAYAEKFRQREDENGIEEEYLNYGDSYTTHVKPIRTTLDDSFAVDECAHYGGHVCLAKELVQNVVEESESQVEAVTPEQPSNETLEDDQGQSSGDINEECNDNGSNNYPDYDEMGMVDGFAGSCEFAYVETKRSQILWPTIDSFSIELGAYTIDEYLSWFDTEEDWMYVIYYQGKSKSEFSDLYKYQAIYSLPTWKYPIAQATASMFFTIEVCKAKPSNCLVDVTYRYETFTKTYRPGVLDFQEKWLHYILDSKIKFFQTVTY